jgi:D-beta-D-heptose 7-phosphate kinase/D-beta-D-heptose 1-phosphate adenosyltransferase|tara:strand:+ start:154 stop:888 length:735 start_codon:yes stop_codon:yes gene_type:complete
VKILVIGESCQDVYQYGSSVRLAPEAPVPVFKSGGERTEMGGMAMNVYNNIQALGVSAELHTNDNWKSITKTRFMDTRTNYLVLRLDENDSLYGHADLENVDVESCDAVVISDYNKGFLSENDIWMISKRNPITFLDTKKILGPWCEGIKYIKINDVEYGRTQHKITDEMFNKLIITRGPDGCEHRRETYPVPKVEIKDAAGAGDTFISALAVEYIKNWSIVDAIKFANECATKVVQKKGVSIV